MASSNFSYIAVYLLGIMSLLSPCILPLIPIYFSVLSKGERKFIPAVIAMLSGFCIAFFTMQILAFKFTNLITEVIGTDFLNKFLGILIIIFGIYHLKIINISFFNSEKRKNLSDTYDKGGYFFPIALGITLGFGWTPCSGPIMFAVIAYASSAKTLFSAILIMFMYSLGFATPFVILALLLEKIKLFSNFILKNMNTIQRISGILLILVGILMMFDKLSILYRI